NQQALNRQAVEQRRAPQSPGRRVVHAAHRRRKQRRIRRERQAASQSWLRALQACLARLSVPRLQRVTHAASPDREDSVEPPAIAGNLHLQSLVPERLGGVDREQLLCLVEVPEVEFGGSASVYKPPGVGQQGEGVQERRVADLQELLRLARREVPAAEQPA